MDAGHRRHRCAWNPARMPSPIFRERCGDDDGGLRTVHPVERGYASGFTIYKLITIIGLNRHEKVNRSPLLFYTILFSRILLSFSFLSSLYYILSSYCAVLYVLLFCIFLHDRLCSSSFAGISPFAYLLILH